MDANKPNESDELDRDTPAAEPTAETAEPAPEQAQPQTPETAAASPAPTGQTGDTPKPKAKIQNFLFGNKYLAIFIMLMLVAGGGIFYVVQISKKEAPKVTTTASLTAEELTALRGNTTIVGDAQTTLDVQSNAVFEGQVVLRKSLEVAGNVKIGTPLSLPAITVNGASTLGQVAANTLSVSGSSSLGDVNIQRNLSVAGTSSFSGAVSVPQLNVSNLVLAGDLLLPRHLSATGGIPTRTIGPAVGSDGTASVSGSDTAGTITINTGSDTGAGFLVTLTFAQKYSRIPHVVVTPVGSAAAGLNYYIINRTSTGFTLATTNAPPINSNFSFDYIVID